MRILFILNNYRCFNNLDTGASVRNTLFVTSLCRLGHVDIISFFREPIIPNLSNCQVIFQKSVVDNINGALYVAISSLIAPTNPYSYYKTNGEKEAIIDSFVEKGNYDMIAIRYVSSAIRCGLLKYSNRLVIDVDDNPAKHYQVLARSLPFPFSLGIKVLSRRIGRMVDMMLKGVRVSFYSNQKEPPCSSSVFLHNTAVSVPLSVPNISLKTPKRMLFVGALTYGPNLYGLKHFIKNVFPEVRKSICDAELHIIGKCDDKCLSWLNSIEGVSAKGFVSNLFDEYRDARVIVIPIYQGSGTSVKFIEGLFMNRPIVSSPMGARGFSEMCKDNVCYKLANDDAMFVKGIIDFLLSPEEANRIAGNAKRFAEEFFSEGRFYNVVENAIVVAWT